MNVAFSHDAFRMQQFGGVSRYFARLHAGLLERGHASQVLAGLHINAYLRGLDGVRGVDAGSWRPARAVKGLTKVVDPVIERQLTRRLPSGAIYHATYYNPRAIAHRPFVVTVYDMIHELHPGDFRPDDPTAARKRSMCEAADLVLAISERTRRDLLERIAVSPDRVIVTGLGVDRPGDTPPDEARQRQSDHLLFVGDRTRAYKNFSSLLTALTRIDDSIRLDCFGSNPTAAEQGEVQRLGLQHRVRWRRGDDAALVEAYRGARALVCPSLLEGFGLPLLEAMVNGCPVICSHLDVFSDVHGGSALAFDPQCVESMATAMQQIFQDDDRWAELRTSGLQRVANWSWDSTVDHTVDAYDGLTA
jgi:glycosyltransferase involved in cell wall biosynthesis